MTPASTRTWDRWTEARTGLGPLYTRNGKRPHIIPSCRTFSTAPGRRVIPLVPPRFTEVHITSPVSSMCLRAKDHFEGSIDGVGAYDSISRKAMLEALITMAGGSEALPFVRSFYTFEVNSDALMPLLWPTCSFEGGQGTIAPRREALRFPGRCLRCHHS